MRILIVRLSSLGDVVCSLPLACALRDEYPEAEITWAVDRRFAAIPRRCDAINHVVEAPGDLRTTGRWVRGLGEFDLAIDAQGLFKSAWIVGWSRAQAKLGYGWQREAAGLFSRRVVPRGASLHVVEQQVDIARAFAQRPVDSVRFGLSPTAEDLAYVDSLIRRPFVLCNPGAGWASKRWPPERWRELVNTLHARGRQVAFLGAKPERAVVEEIGTHQAVSLVEKTNIGQLVALVARASAHVGGDTGSTHLAAAQRVPCVALMSITHPLRSGPYGQAGRCIHQPAGLGEISVDRVLDLLGEA